MKDKVQAPDGDTDFFDIVAGVLRGDTLALYLFILCRDNILQTLIDLMKENCFTQKKRQKADDTLQKILQTQSTPMI